MLGIEQKVKESIGSIRNMKKEDAAWLEDPAAIQSFSKELTTAINAFEKSAEHLPGLDVKALWTCYKYEPPAEEVIVPPEGFPTDPPDTFEQPELFRKLNLDTLMAIFYYPSSARCQYLAARELKKRQWRFHTSSQTWYLRHQVAESTETYERGDFIYFEHVNGWGSKLRANFVFDYCYLEEEIPLE